MIGQRYPTVRERIEELLGQIRDYGIVYSDLAKRVDASSSTFYKWEAGVIPKKNSVVLDKAERAVQEMIEEKRTRESNRRSLKGERPVQKVSDNCSENLYRTNPSGDAAAMDRFSARISEVAVELSEIAKEFRLIRRLREKEQKQRELDGETKTNDP